MPPNALDSSKESSKLNYATKPLAVVVGHGYVDMGIFQEGGERLEVDEGFRSGFSVRGDGTGAGAFGLCEHACACGGPDIAAG